MALVGFQYEPVSLDVNEVCLRKSQTVTEWCRCGKWDVMYTNTQMWNT